MSVHLNRDGSRRFTSDADGSTQTQATGQTQAQYDAAYATFQATWPIAFLRAQKQGALDAFFDANFDLKAFIRAGSAATVTAANVGTFLATITNNYRALRASIAAAADAATVNAININSGWPSNP